MSKRKPVMRLPLPNPVDPGSTVCLVIELPDAPQYISAVKGAIEGLTHQSAWERDIDHFAIDTALRMFDAYNTIRVQPDCNALPVPNWYLDLNMIQGDFYHSAWFCPCPVIFGDGSVGEEYSLAAWATGGPAELRFDIIGRDRATNDPVGGLFDSIEVANQLDPSGQTFQYQIEACDGSTPAGTLTTPQSFGPGEYRTFSLITGNTTVFMITLRTHNDWTCTP